MNTSQKIPRYWRDKILQPVLSPHENEKMAFLLIRKQITGKYLATLIEYSYIPD
jgi:hypothetical protein